MSNWPRRDGLSDPTPQKLGAIETLGFTLPIEFHLQKTLFKDFVFGPLAGRLRRELSNTTNPYRSSIVALRHAIAKLGPIDKPGEQFIRNIPAPSAEYIHLVRTAHEIDGPKKILVQSITCGDENMGMMEGCGAKIKVKTNLADVQMVEGTAQILYTSEGLPYQELTFVDPETQKQIMIKYRVPTLGDQESLWEKMRAKKGEDPGDFLQHQTSHLMYDYDGRGRGLTFEELDALPIKTYDAMMKAASNRYPPHVDTDITVRCGNCAREHELPLAVGEWMRPFEKAASET